MHKEVREVVAVAEGLGFALLPGVDGHGHYVLRHESGQTYRLSSTPGAYTWRANAIATMRRIAGAKSDKPKAGRGRMARTKGFIDTHRSPKASFLQRTNDHLYEEHSAITEELKVMAVACTRDDMKRARRLLARRIQIESDLRARHLPVPATDL